MTDSHSWEGLLAQKLVDKAQGDQKEVYVDQVLKGKHVGLYFSAHWCPPCRGFTPQLASTYSKLKKDGVNFEIVFVSMDRSQNQFDGYFESMPWLAVPWRDDQLRSVLSRKFNVQSIPRLVVLGPTGEVVAEDARSAVSADPNGEKYPWAGSQPARQFPIPWMLLVFLVFWLLNTYFFPPKSKTDRSTTSV